MDAGRVPSCVSADRHAEILAALDASGRVVSADVAARLGVSTDTVRRDLAELGALRRVHGGAVRPVPVALALRDHPTVEVDLPAVTCTACRRR